MKKVIIFVLITIMFGWAIVEFISSSTNDSHTDSSAEDTDLSDEIGLGKNNIAPDFELSTLDGEEVNLSDYRGQRVMLNFWATWCPPCRAEMPDMQEIYDQEDITILAVNMTASEKSRDDVSDFVNDFELTFPILMDNNADIVNLYQVVAYPTSYMIDSNGRIQFMIRGAMNYEQMLQFFNRLD